MQQAARFRWRILADKELESFVHFSRHFPHTRVMRKPAFVDLVKTVGIRDELDRDPFNLFVLRRSYTYFYIRLFAMGLRRPDTYDLGGVVIHRCKPVSRVGVGPPVIEFGCDLAFILEAVLSC